MQMVGQRHTRWQNRAQFIGVAAQMLCAASSSITPAPWQAQKRGGAQPRRLSIDDLPEDAFASSDLPDFERLDDALAGAGGDCAGEGADRGAALFRGALGRGDRAR